jgi:hypothetical protein
MAERVVQSGISVRWEPNAPDAVLVVTGAGSAALALSPHFDDADRDCVIFVWSGARAAVMEPLNDEARAGHRLHPAGLSELLWSGVVEDSEWIMDLERRDRVHSLHDAARFDKLHHFVLPLKEGTVEVAAETVEVLRRPGPSLSAAAGSLQR